MSLNHLHSLKIILQTVIFFLRSVTSTDVKMFYKVIRKLPSLEYNWNMGFTWLAVQIWSIFWLEQEYAVHVNVVIAQSHSCIANSVGISFQFGLCSHDSHISFFAGVVD